MSIVVGNHRNLLTKIFHGDPVAMIASALQPDKIHLRALDSSFDTTAEDTEMDPKPGGSISVSSVVVSKDESSARADGNECIRMSRRIRNSLS
jgi:hypothetical protein